ncbi:alanyl-tRNA editing protein [Burkholderia cepacia]|uniref:Alanine--tRNA ligase n=1 Tax=Burkholderia cepacia TaxID=292 RepID=A0AAQ0FGU2_BURCE|nr:alanyl-tRNA editing protein [Burkholderia cepacia]MCE4128399.1 alanyl-tRNA editing protein [Burkholderia cepacia]MDN7856407.1 alanyl-tRNA editing protein [Burkholderia cepacia]QFS36953.1 tRNA synthetases class II (A) [Burkholderia cepacia]RAQ10039.1 alanyl-tRNA editing protein [Burkholderia cepacia]
MPTEALFRTNAYLRSCEARIVQIGEAGVILDRTVFYPHGGGQLGDTGTMTLADGMRLTIADARKPAQANAHPDDVVHIPVSGQEAVLARLAPGDMVTLDIDWERRYRLMRFHTAAHLMCGVLPYAVDGCSITSDYARLDFVTSDPLSRTDIDRALDELVSAAKSVRSDVVTDAELRANPEWVRTVSVMPPAGHGTVRVVTIDGIDLQPCGGTHVANTAEVGAVCVQKMEKKSSRTRRVVIGFKEGV